jgi:hypothetical protein
VLDPLIHPLRRQQLALMPLMSWLCASPPSTARVRRTRGARWILRGRQRGFG